MEAFAFYFIFVVIGLGVMMLLLFVFMLLWHVRQEQNSCIRAIEMKERDLAGHLKFDAYHRNPTK